MGALRWVPAQATHKAAIERFRCTTPDPTGRDWRMPHPRPWERVVQSGLHQFKPSRTDVVWLLAFETEAETDIVAMTMWSRLDDDGDYALDLIAVDISRRVKGSPSGLGDEAMSIALSTILADAVKRNSTEVLLTARVHEKNQASKRLLRRSDFEYFEQDGDIEIWSHYEEVDQEGDDAHRT